MAVLSGTSGSVVIGAFGVGVEVAEIRSWTLTVEANTVDTTTFGESWTDHTLSILNWTGTFSGFEDTGDAMQSSMYSQMTAGSAFIVNFVLDNTAGTPSRYSGTAVMTGKTVEHTFDGVAQTVFNVRGVGGNLSRTLA